MNIYRSLKVGGGLSRQIQVGQWSYQGCPLSGQLYTHATEPLPSVKGAGPPGAGLHTSITSAVRSGYHWLKAPILYLAGAGSDLHRVEA